MTTAAADAEADGCTETAADIHPIVSPRHPPSAISSTSSRYSSYLPTLRALHSLGSSTVAYPKLERLCVDYGHRLTGSDQLERVIDWVLDEMKAEKLERIDTQQVTVPRWERRQAYAYIVQPTLQPLASSSSSPSTSPPHPAAQDYSPSHHRPLHILTIGRSVATPPEGITAPVVLLHSFEHLSSLLSSSPSALQGKIAFFDVRFTTYGDTVPYRSQSAAKCEAHGALAVLVRSVCPCSLSTPHTGTMRDSAIPAACVTLEDAEVLSRLLTRGVEVVVHLFSSAVTLPSRTSRNVIAELKGREKPEEVVIISGHIDSWDVGQGAHDDGQGIMVAWETLRLLSSSPSLRPRRTVRLVMFTDEETTSAGNKAYLEQTLEEVQAGRVVAAIETDVGCWDAVGFGVTGARGAKEGLAEIAAPLKEWGWDCVCDDGEGVDIAPLIHEGVPGLLLRLEESWWNSDYLSASQQPYTDMLSPRVSSIPPLETALGLP